MILKYFVEILNFTFIFQFLKAEKKSKKLKKSQSEKHLTLSKTRELVRRFLDN